MVQLIFPTVALKIKYPFHNTKIMSYMAISGGYQNSGMTESN